MALVDRGRVDRESERVGKDACAETAIADMGPVPRVPAEGNSAARQLAKETLIVFDWDDTLLPTTWLQRIHNLSGGFMQTYESQALMESLSKACIETLLLAACMGTVIIITNSVPGWVDQSCQLFMPGLLELMRRFTIIARPQRAPLTFKTSAFQREFRTFRNLISVGDGNAERTASLRLQMAPDVVMGGIGGIDSKEAPRSVKSVKLLELPSCQQVHSQLEMVQQRLADIVCYRGHLDLKSRFSAPSGLAQSAKAGVCTLVHFARPSGGSSSFGGTTMGGAAGWPMPDDSKMTGLLSLRSISPGARESPGPGGPTVEQRNGSPTPLGGARQDRRQLPFLGGHAGGASGKSTPEPVESPAANVILERLRAEERADRMAAGTSGELDGGKLDGGTEAADNLFQAMGGAAAVDMVDGGEAEVSVQRSASVAEERTESGSGGGDAGRRSTTSLLSGGLWKVQGVDRGAGRVSCAGLGKKRPVLPTGLGTRSPGAVWRENSAPAAARSF